MALGAAALGRRTGVQPDLVPLALPPDRLVGLVVEHHVARVDGVARLGSGSGVSFVCSLCFCLCLSSLSSGSSFLRPACVVSFVQFGLFSFVTLFGALAFCRPFFHFPTWTSSAQRHTRPKW